MYHSRAYTVVTVTSQVSWNGIFIRCWAPKTWNQLTSNLTWVITLVTSYTYVSYCVYYITLHLVLYIYNEPVCTNSNQLSIKPKAYTQLCFSSTNTHPAWVEFVKIGKRIVFLWRPTTMARGKWFTSVKLVQSSRHGASGGFRRRWPRRRRSTFVLLWGKLWRLWGRQTPWRHIECTRATGRNK